MTHRATHKGWTGLCPIYLAGRDMDTPIPRVWAMLWWMEFWIWVQFSLFDVVAWWGVSELPEDIYIEVPEQDNDDDFSGFAF